MVKVTMERSKRYRVRYLIKGWHRKPHEFVGTFLGDANDIAQFSLRPASGTSPLAYEHILSVEEVTNSVPHANPRKAR